MSKLKLDFTYDYDFFLISIHSTLEDYLFAFHLNHTFNLQLRKNKQQLNFEKKKGSFSIYDCDNQANFTFWSLISNKQITEENMEDSLFSLFDSVYNTYTLLKEKKEVDYFLKIEGDFTKQEKKEIITKINKIQGVLACSETDPKSLKLINNLIY
ncbi:MAG TPA: IPExxxVDY family protein [Flavobacteriia bacterium]|jgi:hypothetical protein|nr:IPExxxVDY family protein [Flavobacteriia bacterium]